MFITFRLKVQMDYTNILYIYKYGELLQYGI